MTFKSLQLLQHYQSSIQGHRTTAAVKLEDAHRAKDLADKGYLQLWITSSNRRSIVVKLTPKGLAALND